MDFEWSTNDVAKMTVTIYETNLTLNKLASNHFEDVEYVLLGIDVEKKQIGIKPIYKEDIDNNIYPQPQCHHISLGKSYARISNKAFIANLSQTFHFDFRKHPFYKYTAVYDFVHSVMIIQL